MQEVVEEKTVSITIRAGKVTGRVLAQAIRAIMRKAKNHEPVVKHGKQSVKSLTKQGASLSSVPIDGDNIGSFSKTARKFNVDFALKRDESEMPPKWVVFFKAKDADAITAAFNEYTKTMLKREERKPSLRVALAKAKEFIKHLAPPVKNRSRGGHEL